MKGWLGFPQKPLHPAPRRWRARMLEWFSNRPVHRHRLYRVEIEGHSYKRAVFPDTWAADRVARNLERFGDASIWPRLVLAKEAEVWVEFVEGQILSELGRLDAPTLEKLADLFGVLYTREPELRPIERVPWARALADDLRFLAEVGVIDTARRDALLAVAERETPAQVWVGYDCSDAILKNFVRDGEGRVRCIDLECLGAEQLLGSGFAKAALRWLGPDRDVFLGHLRARSVPDFESYLPFVELSFVAFWLKSSFLERKRRFVDPRLLDRFVGA